MVQDASVGVCDDVPLLIVVQGCFECRLVVRVMLAGLDFFHCGAGNVVAVEERGKAVLEAVNEVAGLRTPSVSDFSGAGRTAVSGFELMTASSFSFNGWCTSTNSPWGRRRIRPDS